MKISRVIFWLMMSTAGAFAQPAEIVIVRHAEEPPLSANSIHLSTRGMQRANLLVTFFRVNAKANQHGRPVALFAPRPASGSSLRSRETLAPLSRTLRVSIQEPVTSQNTAALANMILHNRSYAGRTVVIAWVHQQIPQLISAFGVKPRPKALSGSEYDRAFVITFPNGQATLENIPQRLLSGDASK